MTELEILDDAELAKRWHKDKEGISAEAIAKWIDRICNKKRAKHLKSFKSGKKRLFRIEDVREYEATHVRHFLSSIAVTNTDTLNEWITHTLQNLLDDDLTLLNNAKTNCL